VGGHLETSQPALATGQAMKKDSPWTQKIDQRQRTENHDRRHLINKTDTGLQCCMKNSKRQQKPKDSIRILYNGNQMKYKDDNDTESVLKTNSHTKSKKDNINLNCNEIKRQKLDNDSFIVQRTEHMNTDSRRLMLFEIEIKENLNITKAKSKEIPNKSIHEKTNHTNCEIYIKQEPKSLIIEKKKTKSKKKLINDIGENLNLFVILLFFLSPIHSYTLRGKIKSVPVLEENRLGKNIVINKKRVDNDTLTNVTNNSTTTCYCQTTQLSTLELSTPTPRPTSTGTTTLSGRCICPGSVQSLAEEETATNMPNTDGKRRRRKEIEGMDLFVDGFDQKILKKMPFLGSY